MQTLDQMPTKLWDCFTKYCFLVLRSRNGEREGKRKKKMNLRNNNHSQTFTNCSGLNLMAITALQCSYTARTPTLASGANTAKGIPQESSEGLTIKFLVITIMSLIADF